MLNDKDSDVRSSARATSVDVYVPRALAFPCLGGVFAVASALPGQSRVEGGDPRVRSMLAWTRIEAETPTHTID